MHASLRRHDYNSAALTLILTLKPKANPMEANDLVTVYTLGDANKAELIKAMLHNEGIACEIDGENQAGLSGVGAMEIGILVRARDADAARRYIDQHEERPASDS